MRNVSDTNQIQPTLANAVQTQTQAIKNLIVQ